MTAATLVAVKTVLVADDTAFVRDRFKTALESAGHRAITVRTGPELVTCLREAGAQIDLVVMDLRLPSGRGLELLRAMRKAAPTLPPIIVFSGTIASAQEVRALASLGVAGYVNEYTALQHIVPSLTPYLFPDTHNHRASPRVVLGIPVSYRYGNTIAASVTLNVSEGGLAIRTTSPLDSGTAMRLRLRLPGSRQDLDVDGRVVWVDRRVGMGVQFIGLPPTDRDVLRVFVESHFFSNRKA